MSEQEQEATVLHGFDAYRDSGRNSGVDGAQRALTSALEQQSQAKEGLIDIDGTVAEATQALKDAQKARRNQKIAAVVEMGKGLIALPFRAFRTVSNAAIQRPVLVGLPIITLTTAFFTVDKDNLNLPSTSSVGDLSFSETQSDFGKSNDEIQVASLPDIATAVQERDRLNIKMPGGDFYIAGTTVRTNADCPKLILSGVVPDQAGCKLGMALAAN